MVKVINGAFPTPYTCRALFNDKRVLMLLPFCSPWMICAAEVHCTSRLVWRTLADISVGRDAGIENESDVGMVNNLATFVVKSR